MIALSKCNSSLVAKLIVNTAESRVKRNHSVLLCHRDNRNMFSAGFRIIICLSIPTKITVFSRSMLKTTKHITDIMLNNGESRQIAHSALALCKTISIPSVIKAIATNNINDASQDIHNYINHPQGTIQLRTTLFSTFGEHAFDLEKRVSHYNNPKLSVINKDYKIPVRSLAELHIMENFLRRFNSFVECIDFTGDAIRFDRKKNPFQDAIAHLYKTMQSESSTRTFDVKSGNFAKAEYFKGEIRQITTENGEIIWYPNKGIDLKEQHYLQLVNRLKSERFLKDAKLTMEKSQYNYFESEASHTHMLIVNNHDFQEVENCLMDIQTLSTFPKAFNYINVYQISKEPLTQSELSFIEGMSQYINPKILNNPRSMQQFMLQALKVYRSSHDPHVFKTIAPLKQNQGWLSSEIDKIATDIFL